MLTIQDSTVYFGSASPESGSGAHKETALLSITTAPAAPFEKGSKYYNDTTKKIYTAVADDTWDNAKEADPVFGAYYTYGGKTYTWDGNTLELFELEEYQKKLVSGVNIKTINGESVLGSGNLSVSTYQSFNSSWITNTTFADFMSSVNSDTSATPGMAYLGELTCSGLPMSGNVEAVIEIQNGPNNYKTIHTVITSGTDAPYRWEYTYWNNGSSVSGWIGFQPQIIAGNNITIGSDGRTISASGGTPALTYYNGTGTTITIADTSLASLVKVYKNGLLLRPDNDGTTYDYSISGTTLTLATALEATDTITLEVF